MSAIEKFKEYINTEHPEHPVVNSHYIKLILDAVCEGGIKLITAEGTTYEVHADVMETEE